MTIEPVAGRERGGELIDAFKRIHREAFDRLRDEIRQHVPATKRIEFVSGEDPRDVFTIRFLEEDEPSGGLTPVMTRLGPVELETLDTLVTVGIAVNRAQAVRWALGRIHDRAAYAQLRERAREIEQLKAQF